MAMRMFPIQSKSNCHSRSRQEMLPHPAAFGPAAPAATGEEDFPPVLRLLTYNLFLRRARIPRKHASSLQRTGVLAVGRSKSANGAAMCCQFGMICSVHGAHVWVGTTMTPVLGPGWYPWLSVPRIVRDCDGVSPIVLSSGFGEKLNWNSIQEKVASGNQRGAVKSQ